MRATMCCVVVCLLMSTVSLKADLPALPICTAGNDQMQPDIDGDWIVWHDARNGTSNWNIFGYILSEPNEISICAASGNQRYVAVGGNRAVWQDERNSQRDIYAFDLQSRVPVALPAMPLADGIYQRYPDVSENYIIYEHMIDGFYNLFAYHLPTGPSVQIAPAAYNQFNSNIDGSLVVWTENQGAGDQIYYRDLSRSNPAATVSASAYAQYYPAVSGDVVVWAEDRGTETEFDIYGYDLSDTGEFVVYSGSGNQTRPAICGNLIVWQDESKGTSNFDLWGTDVTAGNPFAIATGTQNDQLAAISGRRVVWQRGMEGNFDIYTALIPSPTVIAVVSPNGGEQVLAGTELEIAWQMNEGALPDEVKIEFSSNNGADWQVVEPAVPADAAYLWKPVASIDSQQCLIRVSFADEPSVRDISDAVFTIFQCDADLTADITGDCFVGIEDFAEMAAQWLTCGNPYDADWCVQ